MFCGWWIILKFLTFTEWEMKENRFAEWVSKSCILCLQDLTNAYPPHRNLLSSCSLKLRFVRSARRTKSCRHSPLATTTRGTFFHVKYVCTMRPVVTTRAHNGNLSWVKSFIAPRFQQNLPSSEKISVSCCSVIGSLHCISNYYITHSAVVCTRWFKYDQYWFVCKQAALRSSCATLRE